MFKTGIPAKRPLSEYGNRWVNLAFAIGGLAISTLCLWISWDQKRYELTFMSLLYLAGALRFGWIYKQQSEAKANIHGQ